MSNDSIIYIYIKIYWYISWLVFHNVTNLHNTSCLAALTTRSVDMIVTYCYISDMMVIVVIVHFLHSMLARVTISYIPLILITPQRNVQRQAQTLKDIQKMDLHTIRWYSVLSYQGHLTRGAWNTLAFHNFTVQTHPFKTSHPSTITSVPLSEFFPRCT